MLGEHNCRVGL
ncbi:unnamed protein product [Timema podura]|uniref:Uncharacterized protein n=1 Tax=Timema podura TaxID=61482 RepID=A0ABN7PRD7_TIMPD|nr:unnamed protein product [Timema podura]